MWLDGYASWHGAQVGANYHLGNQLVGLDASAIRALPEMNPTLNLVR